MKLENDLKVKTMREKVKRNNAKKQEYGHTHGRKGKREKGIISRRYKSKKCKEISKGEGEEE